jgi:hypothetical protein
MQIFNAIGLEISKVKTLNDLAENTKIRGEASLSARPSGVVHGRCWRIGSGLEVWTILYESETGEIFYADCRPGFRARFPQNIRDWNLYENEKGGTTTVEGKIEDCREKIFFQLQNLTEVGAKNFRRKVLSVGLCGLAYRAKVSQQDENFGFAPLSGTPNNRDSDKTNWRLCGRVLSFDALRNSFSGSDLYWIHLDLGDFNLEILVNQHALKENELRAGASVKADVWLQGHIITQSTFFSSYEGVDWSFNTVDFWNNFKRLN